MQNNKTRILAQTKQITTLNHNNTRNKPQATLLKLKPFQTTLQSIINKQNIITRSYPNKPTTNN